MIVTGSSCEASDAEAADSAVPLEALLAEAAGLPQAVRAIATDSMPAASGKTRAFFICVSSFENIDLSALCAYNEGGKGRCAFLQQACMLFLVGWHTGLFLPGALIPPFL